MTAEQLDKTLSAIILAYVIAVYWLVWEELKDD
jgi:hypothetical protein